MYEGDTMSEMFKRTKKCCAKILRKISFNTSEPPSIPLRIGSQSARYTQQRNRTNSDNSPQNSCGSRESNQHVNAINSSFSDDGSCDESECNMFRISPRIFTAKGTSYVRVDSDSKNFYSLDSEEQPARLRKQTTKSQNKSGNEGDGILSIGNKVYIGLNERTQERISKTSNNSCTVVAKPTLNGLTSTKSDDSEKKNISNCSDHKTETTSFIVAQNLIEKFDSCLNLAAQNFRNSLSPRIYSTRDNNGARRCCRTANFNILEEDANENVTTCHGEHADFDFKKVVFEKVKYDRNKKYLRHTPSTSSAESASSSPKSPCNGTLISFGKSRSTLSLDNSISEQDFPVNRLPYPHYTDSWDEENGNFDKFNGNFELYTSDTHLPAVDNLQNRFFSQWDGNGNSCERTKILSDDPWDVFDNKMNKARDKKLQLLRREDFNKTSPRSSSTTLETWVEDEIFDNSFNEGLEKRCITIER